MTGEWWIYQGAKGPVVFLKPINAEGFHVIEKSAYDRVCKERDECYERKIFSHRKCQEERDTLAAELDLSNKRLEHFQSVHRDLAAQLAEAKAEVEAFMYNEQLAIKRMTRLERALAYARKTIGEYRKYGDPPHLEVMDRMERGE